MCVLYWTFNVCNHLKSRALHIRVTLNEQRNFTETYYQVVLLRCINLVRHYYTKTSSKQRGTPVKPTRCPVHLIPPSCWQLHHVGRHLVSLFICHPIVMQSKKDPRVMRVSHYHTHQGTFTLHNRRPCSSPAPSGPLPQRPDSVTLLDFNQKHPRV